MRTRLPAPERRALIERAAAELFAERGYEGTRLEDVAAAAHVTKPVLYRHFASKSDLYVALLERHRRDLPTFMEPGGDLAEALHRWFAYVEERPFTWKMIFRDSGGDATVQAARDAVRADARAVMSAIVAATGAVPAEQVDALAELVREGMAHLALWWMDHPEVSREIVVAATLKLLGSGLTPPAPTRRRR